MSAPRPSPPPPPSATTTYTVRPWREFFDKSAISLPNSISESRTRINKNLPYFRGNYAILALMIILLINLISNITTITFFLAVAFLAALCYYFSARLAGSPIKVFGFTIQDKIVGLTLFLTVMLCVVICPNGSFVLPFFYLVYSVLLCLHGALKVPSLDDEEDAYGRLLDPTAGSDGANYNTMQ